MRLTATDPQAHTLRAYYWPIKGCPRHEFKTATAFDTDEKWIEFVPYLPNPSDSSKFRLMTADGGIVHARAYIDFDIVDMITGKTIYEVRQ